MAQLKLAATDAKTLSSDLWVALGIGGEILRCAPFLRQGRQDDGVDRAPRFLDLWRRS
jgi:hypothetical protein